MAEPKVRVEARVYQHESAQFKAAAERDGRSLSSWLRQAALLALIRQGARAARKSSDL